MFRLQNEISEQHHEVFDSLSATDTVTSLLLLGKSRASIYFSTHGSYHCQRISLILLPTFMLCLIALSIWTPLESGQARHIWIELFTAIVLHPYKTFLCSLPDLWLLLFGKLVPNRNCAFSLDTDPVTSSQGRRTRARTQEWDMTAEPAFCRLCDELKHSVDESGRLDDGNQVASKLKCSRDDIAGSRKPCKLIYIFPLPAHRTYNFTYLAAVSLLKNGATLWPYEQLSVLGSSWQLQSCWIVRLGFGRPVIAPITIDKMVVSTIDVTLNSLDSSSPGQCHENSGVLVSPTLFPVMSGYT